MIVKTIVAILLVAGLSLQAAPKHEFLPIPPTSSDAAEATPAAVTNADAPVAAQPVQTPTPPTTSVAVPGTDTPPPTTLVIGAQPPVTTPEPSAMEPYSAPPTTAAPPPTMVVPSPSPAMPSMPSVPGGMPAPAMQDAQAPMPGYASPPPEEPATNIFRFQSMDLKTFLDLYADLVGRTVLATPNLGGPTITLKTQSPLTRSETIDAFDTVLAMNGVAMVKMGDKFVKAVPQQQALTEAAAFSKLSAKELPDASAYVTHIVQLQYVRPSEIIPVIQPFGKINSIVPVESSQMIIIRDYAENVKRMLEVIKEVDVAIPAEIVSEVIPIRYALASEISAALGSVSAGGATTSVGSRPNTGLGGAGTGTGSRFGSRTGTTGYNQPGMIGQPPGTTAPYAQPGAANPTQAQPSFSDRLRQIVQRASQSGEFQILGQTKIIADERTNSLLIFASREDMKMIKEIVAKLDVVLPQVLIETIILEVALTDNEELAFDYVQTAKQHGRLTSAWADINKAPPLAPPGVIGDFSTNLLGGFNWFGKINDDFYIRFRAAAQDGRVSILSRPRIQTSHAVPANLFVGETRPYPTGTSYGGYGGNYSQIQQLPIGITLDVLPLINQEGLVVMDIIQRVEAIGQEVLIENVGRVPSTFNRSANAKVSVRSGETIVLGGFIRADKNTSNAGVPVLKDIPLLGFFFRASNETGSRQELIILIRPTVLPNPSDAALVAKEIKAGMPLVNSAEVELTRQWEKFQAVADQQLKEQAERDQKNARRKEYREFNEVTPVNPSPKYSHPQPVAPDPEQ